MNFATWLRPCLIVLAMLPTACAVHFQSTAYFITASSREHSCRSALSAVRVYALAHGYYEVPSPVAGGGGPMPGRLGRFVRVKSFWPTYSVSALEADCVGDRLAVTATQDGRTETNSAKDERQHLYDELVIRFPHLRLAQRQFRDSFDFITGDF